MKTFLFILWPAIVIFSLGQLRAEGLIECQKNFSKICKKHSMKNDINCFEKYNSEFTPTCKPLLQSQFQNQKTANKCGEDLMNLCPIDDNLMKRNMKQAIAKMQVCMQKNLSKINKLCGIKIPKTNIDQEQQQCINEMDKLCPMAPPSPGQNFKEIITARKNCLKQKQDDLSSNCKKMVPK